MSFHTAAEPECRSSSGSIDLVIEPKKKDLGDFTVRRVLPSSERRMVGPFIFFDHMGPAEFPPGQSIQVRPHPHIGIATITYLFDGEIMHRDSTGAHQLIRAGAVNLMTAGRGITHSERPGSDLDTVSQLHGIQSWMALPDAQQEIEPAFAHYPTSVLPELHIDGVTVRVIIGMAFGETSPVRSYSTMLYLECILPGDSALALPTGYKELAVYVVTGEVGIDGQCYPEGVMAVACPGRTILLSANQPSRVMVIGGDPVGERHIWWNFVSSSVERIETAKADWKAGRFDPVPGETEFIPLPE